MWELNLNQNTKFKSALISNKNIVSFFLKEKSLNFCKLKQLWAGISVRDVT